MLTDLCCFVVSNNALFVNVALVVHYARDPHLDWAGDWLPDWFGFAAVVEAHAVFVHVLHVWRLFSTADELLDADLRRVGVLPRTEHGRSLPRGSFGRELAVQAELAQN